MVKKYFFKRFLRSAFLSGVAIKYLKAKAHNATNKTMKPTKLTRHRYADNNSTKEVLSVILYIVKNAQIFINIIILQ